MRPGSGRFGWVGGRYRRRFRPGGASGGGNPYALAYALVVFADDGEIEIPTLARQMPLIRQIENAQVVGDGLQVAVAAAHAARALRIVLGQQQLHVGATGLAGLGAVGVDHHAVEHVVVAGLSLIHI